MLKKFLEDNEENFISIVTLLIILISIVIIIIVWVSNSFVGRKKDVINKYEEVSYNEEMTRYYTQLLTTLVKTNNTDFLFSKMNYDFLGKNNLNEGNFKSYVLANNLVGNSPAVISSDVYQFGENCIFRIYYKNYEDYKYINFIESKPYEYTVSFEQDALNVQDNITNYTGQEMGIQYECDLKELGNNFVKYSLKLKNANELDVDIDFNNAGTFELITDEGEVKNSDVIASEIGKLSQDSSYTKELYFEVPSNEYSTFSGIRINNIGYNGEYFSIVVDF